MNQPLRGVRVVDFGQGVAGPYCGQLLADNGADVIKIEPPRGDWSRTMGSADSSGLGGTFVSVNRNKRGLCLDLKNPDAVRIARALALKADVLIESFRPGVMDRLGLGHEGLARENPRIVYCTVTGFGETGPNVDLPAGDSIIQAYGGLMSIVGERDGAPLRVGNVVSDMLAGMNAFSGCLLALLARGTTGKSQKVNVALLDSIVAFQAAPLTEYLLTGTPPTRMGNDHPLIAPSGVVHTSDNPISFAVLDHQWERFCSGIGLARLTKDPRFATSASRQQNRHALGDELAPIFRERSAVEWLAALRELDVVCAPINEYPALIADPQVVHNELIGSVLTAGGKPVPMLRNPIRLQGGAADHAAPPRLGEHSREILATELGYTDPSIEGLLADRAVLCSPQPPMRASARIDQN